MINPEIRISENRRDSILIVNHRNGDKKAFGLLTEFHRKELNFINYHVLHNWQDAEDATQEEIIILLKALDNGKYVEKQYFGGWLIIRARHYLYHLQASGQLITIEVNKEAKGIADDVIYEDMSNELLIRLDMIMRKHPERDRLIIRMRIWDKCSWKVIGLALNITENSASGQFDKILKRLKAEILKVKLS